jgi:hypothetical protein
MVGARFAPIGGFEGSMVRRWLERMEQEFSAVSSWRLIRGTLPDGVEAA